MRLIGSNDRARDQFCQIKTASPVRGRFPQDQPSFVCVHAAQRVGQNPPVDDKIMVSNTLRALRKRG